MRIAYELRVPSAGKQVSSGPDWLHEIKLDGYRMLVIRENERVRLLSENGTDWTRRFPWIVETAREIRKTRSIGSSRQAGAQKRIGNALPKQVQAVIETGRELGEEKAKGLGRAR